MIVATGTMMKRLCPNLETNSMYPTMIAPLRRTEKALVFHVKLQRAF